LLSPGKEKPVFSNQLANLARNPEDCWRVESQGGGVLFCWLNSQTSESFDSPPHIYICVCVYIYL
jgi:hypothetical protein